MTWMILGLVLFFGTHSISIVARGWRDRMAARCGEWGWKGIYSVFAIAGFVLIVYGYGQAKLAPIVLYTPPTWLRHVAFLLLVPVFPLLLAAYLPGRLKTLAKHPMLNAVKFWATAHLLVKGTLASTLLYGAFLVWASVDRVSVKYRPRPGPPTLPASSVNDVIAIVGGLAIYVAFLLFAHRLLIGVSPLPGH
ncbi:MAG: NnrU family protein [Gammaproteobacteria bacterium]|nr:NnrU family protein [Gammaproteobacteria bacterium]